MLCRNRWKKLTKLSNHSQNVVFLKITTVYTKLILTLPLTVLDLSLILIQKPCNILLYHYNILRSLAGTGCKQPLHSAVDKVQEQAGRKEIAQIGGSMATYQHQQTISFRLCV